MERHGGPFSTFDEFFATIEGQFSQNKNITLFCFPTTYDLSDTQQIGMPVIERHFLQRSNNSHSIS